MSTTLPKNLFAKSRIAREIIRENAEALFKQYMEVIQLAKDSGDYETALKHMQWLIEHMPADEDGARMIDISVDKKQEAIERGPTGPTIQIGINVGGITKPKAIEAPKAEVIDAD